MPFVPARIDLDLDAAGGREEQESAPTKAQRKAADAKVARLKAELKGLLAQPLVAKGVSTRYITSGAVSIADDMLAGNCASPYSISGCHVVLIVLMQSTRRWSG